MSIYVTRPSMPELESFIEEIKPSFENHIITNMGPVYKKLQHQLIEYLDVPHLSLFAHGHLALEMAIQALGLGDQFDHEIITTPYTFVSTSHAIVRNHLHPVFCDIKPDDYTIDPQKIEALITDKTVAILPVHVYGNLCDVDSIQRIADKHGLKVIYDAAHAFGVKYRGIGVGNFGDASMFSFHATKVFNTIEGGAVAYRKDEYRDALHELKNFGIHGQDDVLAIGGNAKLDEFRAAMGICNLRRIEEGISARALVAARYDEHLANVPGLRIKKAQKDVLSNYAYYPLYIDERVFKKNRDQVFAELKGYNIYARKYFYPALNEMTCYKDIYDKQATPIAHEVSQRIIALPLYEGLALEDVDRICEIILDGACQENNV